MNEKIQPYLIPLSIVAAGGLIAGGIFLSGQKIGLVSQEPAVTLAPENEGGPGAEQFRQIAEKIEIDSDPLLGDPAATVVMIEFSDFQCPFCKRHHQETFPELKSKYLDTGKVKLVFKDFPLPFHENAQGAAEAGQCAFEQGKFWEYQDKLFANQENLDKKSLKQYAQELGLNQTQFDDCLDSEKYRQAVRNDIAAGQRVGIQGTPSFVINDTLVDGAYPFSVFESVIEEKLK